jgi:hypothetical protein
MAGSAADRWAVEVRRWRESGKSAPEYARSKPYAVRTLTWWASRLKRDAESAEAHLAVKFVPVTTVARESVATGVWIEIGDIRVGVERRFDADVLGAVVEVLRGRQ